MTSNRRATVRANLKQALPHILQLISQIFTDKKALPTESVTQAIKCLSSWIQLDVPTELIENIFDQILEIATTEQYFEPAIEALTLIISNPNLQTAPNTVKTLALKVLSLESYLLKLLGDEAFETATPLANLFIAFGEIHSRFLLNWTSESEEGKVHATKMVGAILRISSCSAQYPTHETLSEMAFGFWYIFQDDIIACEPQQHQQCVGVFGSAYHSLVEALLQKSMYPLNDADFTSDQKEQFRCYRTDVADTIMYCFNILRDDLLQLLNHHLDEAISKCKMHAEQYWPYLETCLYSWSAIGEAMVEEEENDLLVKFLTKLPTIPYGNKVKVISAALDCIGGFAEWLANYPNIIVNLVPLITGALSNAELALSASMALKDLARDCPEALKPCANDVISFSVAAVRSQTLKTGECIRLMYPIGKMISVSTPSSQILPQLEPIIMPYLVELQELSQQQPSVPIKAKIMFIVKLLTTLIQAMDIKNPEPGQAHPVAVLAEQLLPLIQSLALKWNTDEEIMDAIWMLVRQVSPSLVERNKPLLGQVLSLMSQCFAIAPHSMLVDVAKHIVHLNNNDPALKQDFISLFARICQKIVECLMSGNANPSDYSDLVATTFQNVSQMMKRNTDYFGQQAIDPAPMFHCACYSITMPESSAVKYSSSFINHCVMLSHENPYFRQVVQMNGELLFRQVMICIGGDKPCTHLEHYVDILSVLSKRFFDDLCKWLQAFTREEGFPSAKVGMSEKENFVKALLRERINKRKMNEIVQEFALACRGLSS